MKFTTCCGTWSIARKHSSPPSRTVTRLPVEKWPYFWNLPGSTVSAQSLQKARLDPHLYIPCLCRGTIRLRQHPCLQCNAATTSVAAAETLIITISIGKTSVIGITGGTIMVIHTIIIVISSFVSCQAIPYHTSKLTCHAISHPIIMLCHVIS